MATALPFRQEMEFTYGVPKSFGSGVRRIVANNPNAFTFKGTNTYLVGETELAVIDPGPEDGAHLDAIMAAANGRPITTILLTHTHRDHCDGLPALQTMTKAKTAGYAISAQSRGAQQSSPSGKEFVNADFVPDIPLEDGDTLEGQGWRLTALFTPGHAPDHLCFELEGTGIVFSGDHVMGWNTTVVAPPEGHMGNYMSSLEKLAKREGDRLYLPGHGGSIEQPRRVVSAYLVHRKWREAAILDCIRKGEATVSGLRQMVYPNVAENVAAAAALSIFAHVEHLHERGLVVTDGQPSFDGVFSPATLSP